MIAGCMTAEGVVVEVRRIVSEVHTLGHELHCVHLIGEPPQVVELLRGPVGRLGFQPVFCPAPSPLYASRVGEVVTIGFDRRGACRGRSCSRRLRIAYRFAYRLMSVTERTVIAIREDTR